MVLDNFEKRQRRIIRYVAYLQKFYGVEIVEDAKILDVFKQKDGITLKIIDNTLTIGVDEGIIERYVGFNNQGLISDPKSNATYFPVKKDVDSSITACRILPDKLDSVVKYFGEFECM